MKHWARYLPGYIPPLAILSFLLFTNLFTRVGVLRGYLFPGRNITISALYDEETPDDGGIPLLADAKEAQDQDTVACSEPLYRIGRTAFEEKRYGDAIRTWAGMLDSSTCNLSALLNNIGIACLRSAKTRDAEKYFLKAVETDTANARAWYNLGVAQSRQGLARHAAESYRHAIANNKGLSNPHFNLGVLTLKKKDYGAARTYFRNALSWGAEKYLCWYNIALSYEQQDSLEQAKDGYRECIRFDPGQTSARLRMAELFLAQGNPDSALIVALEADRIDAGNPEISIRLAKISIERKDFNEALAYLEEAERRQPGLIEVAYQRARVYGLKGDDKLALRLYKTIMARDPSNPRVYYNIGVNLMDLGLEREALDAYGLSLKADPSYWKAAYNLGVYYLKKDLPHESEPFFRQVVEVMPERALAHYNLGLAYLREGNLIEARKSFGHAVRLDSTYVEGRYNLALTLMKDGQNDSAESVFQSVLHYSPCHAKSFYNLGLLWRRNGDERIADTYYAKAIACRNGNYPSAWYNRALCKYHQQEFDSALVCIRHATSREDSESVSAKAMILQARLYDTLGFSDSADVTLRWADSLAGGDTDALVELAEYYTRRGDANRARLMYRNVLASDSANASILLAAANIEEMTGNLDTAEALFKRAIGQDAANTDALRDYAKLLVRMKRNVDALRALQSAIMIEPGSVDLRLQTALIYASEDRTNEYGREIAKLQQLPMSSSEAHSVGKMLYRADLYQDAQKFLDDAAGKAPGQFDIRYMQLLCREKAGSASFDTVREWSAFIHDFPRDNLGHIKLAKAYMQKGSWKPARECLIKALNIEDSDDARYALAKTCWELGDITCARKQLEVYIKRNPTDRKGKELYDNIAGKL